MRFPGELEGLPHSKAPLPAGHEFEVLVRQIEPGVRLRIVFCRNVGVPIADVEPLIHALFDVVSASEGGVISGAQVAELAMRYAGAGEGGPSGKGDSIRCKSLLQNRERQAKYADLSIGKLKRGVFPQLYHARPRVFA